MACPGPAGPDPSRSDPSRSDPSRSDPTGFDLSGFGPARDGRTLDTAAFQRGVDALAAAGGGTLRVGAGTYRVGGILLRSGVTLRLDAGATLLASGDYRDFATHRALTCAEQSRRALLYARGATDVAVTGHGRIHGNAAAYAAARPDEHGYRSPAARRPRMVLFEDCERVRVEGVTVEQAPMWSVHLAACRHVSVTGLRVFNDLDLSNTDALNLDGCQQVQVSGCDLTAGDDGICIKTTALPEGLQRPARHIVITNCTVRSASCAVKVGTETFADVEDVLVSNCVVHGSNRGVGLFSRDGGRLRRLAFDQLTLECRQGPAAFWGTADPVVVSVRRRDPAVVPGVVEDVRFSRITGTAEGAITLHAEEAGLLRRVTLDDVSLEQRACGSPRQGWYDLRPPVNPANPTGAGLDNAHRIGADGTSWGVQPYPGGLPGLFAHRVTDLAVHRLRVRRPVPLPAGWNQQVVVRTG